MPKAVEGYVFHRRLSVSDFPHYISKTDAVMITELDMQNNAPLRILKTTLFWGQRVKGQGYESRKECRRGSLHSCECWLLRFNYTQ